MAPAETLHESASLILPRMAAEQDFRSAKRYTKIAFECLATREFSDYAYWRSLAMRLLDCAIKWRDAGAPSTLERVALVDIGKQKQVRIPRTARLKQTRDGSDDDYSEEELIGDSDDYVEEPEIILPPMTGTFLAAIRKPVSASVVAAVTPPSATVPVAPISFVGVFSRSVNKTAPATASTTADRATSEATAVSLPGEKNLSFALAFSKKK
jgi:hypothetical protein